MTDITRAIRNLYAWNEGDSDNHPEGYGPDALEWQIDLQVVLDAAMRMQNAICPKLGPEARELLGETIEAERMCRNWRVAAAIEFLMNHHDRTHKAMEP